MIDNCILLELYRGKQYCNLQKIFLYLCINNLDQSIFTNKKTLGRTISNLLSSWMFTLYSKYTFDKDPFFPENCDYCDNLIKTLTDYSSLYYKEVPINKINKIITDLKYNYNNIYKNIDKYKESTFYNKNKKNYNINKKTKSETRDNHIIYFYKFNITFSFNLYINNQKLRNILNNIIIPTNIYENMKNKYTGDMEKLDEIIFIILFRYQLLSSNNNQLAVLPNVLDKMNNDFNLQFECFASAINTSTNKFCSLYYDIEKYFGSIGSFFNNTFNEGCYSFNPPYQKDIIENGINRLLYFLDESNKNLCFIITIPIWDIDGKNKMKQINSENNNDIINYEEMNIIQKIKENKYFYGLRMISKNDFTYIDYNFHLYKNKTIQNTYIIVLSNFSNNYIDTINKYDFFSWDF
jgi:hypothetical protein